MDCKCQICVNLTKVIDNKDRVRYQCVYAPNKEWLCGMCEDELNETCGKFVKKEGVKYEQK